MLRIKRQTALYIEGNDIRIATRPVLRICAQARLGGSPPAAVLLSAAILALRFAAIALCLPGASTAHTASRPWRPLGPQLVTTGAARCLARGLSSASTAAHLRKGAQPEAEGARGDGRLACKMPKLITSAGGQCPWLGMG